MTKRPQDWSIESELLKLSGESCIERAVVKLGLLREDQSLLSIDGDAEWKAGGNETYIYTFSVFANEKIQQKFILKAVTAFSPVSSLNKILEEWVARRRLLSSAEVHVPKLFYYGEGVVLEEFVDYDLVDILREPERQDELLQRVFYYAGVLSRFGFSPIAPFNDLRTDRANVYVIDFGEDLGPPHFEIFDPMDLYRKAVGWINSQGIDPSGEQLNQYHANYLLGVHSNSTVH